MFDCKCLIFELQFYQSVQPDTVPGDIVFVLQLKDHPNFKRQGDDLFIEHTLNLTEALCGYQFVITHLDDRQLLIKSCDGEIVKPGLESFQLILLFKLELFSVL